jgi:hypothetical protein
MTRKGAKRSLTQSPEWVESRRKRRESEMGEKETSESSGEGLIRTLA